MTSSPAEDTPRAPRRFPTTWFVRVGVSSAVLAITLWLLPTDRVVETLHKISPAVWFGSLGCFLLGHLVSALKWRLLIQQSETVTVLTAIRAHFAGLVANLCLPGVAGGDVVRAGIVMRKSKDGASIAIGSLADRLLDMFALLTLAFVGAEIAVTQSEKASTVLLQVALALGSVLGAAALFAVLGPRLKIGGKLGKLLTKLSAAIRGLAAAPGKPLTCFLLSLAIQSSFVGVNIFLAEQTGVSVPPAAWFMAWPLAKLLAVAPVSVAGLGVREASLAGLLSQFGAEPAAVVAVGLLWQSILFAGGLLGGLLLLAFGRFQSSAVVSAEVVSGPMDS